MMFSVFCPTHGSQVLLSDRDAIEFHNSDTGPSLRWRCHCGQEGLLDRAGSRPEPSLS